MRLFCLVVLFLVQSPCSYAESLRTRLVLASYRLEHPQTSGTCFLLRRPDPAESDRTQYLLVTAAHGFEGMKSERTMLILRQQDESGTWQAVPTEIVIRVGDRPLWHRHPKEDVGILKLELPENVTANALPLEVLATAEDWNAEPLEPGSLIRSVGFPHASIFKPSKAGFPNTRLGCIAEFPLTPIESHPKFLVDFNVFEGDSGGAIYSEEFTSGPKIIGLVHGQHFIDERYKMIYTEGMIRKRLGVAIIVNSAVILETIEGMPNAEKSDQ